jgi:hypothetical protein
VIRKSGSALGREYFIPANTRRPCSHFLPPTRLLDQLEKLQLSNQTIKKQPATTISAFSNNTLINYNQQNHFNQQPRHSTSSIEPTRDQINKMSNH